MGHTLDRIMQHADEIRAEGAVGDTLMRLPDTSAKRLRESGVIRMFQPKEFGGQEAHPREFAETVMAIGALDGATGWVAGIVGVHPWELTFFDTRAQEEIWGARTATCGWPRRTRRWVSRSRWTADTSSTALGVLVRHRPLRLDHDRRSVGDKDGNRTDKVLHVLLPPLRLRHRSGQLGRHRTARHRLEGSDRRGRVHSRVPHDRRRHRPERQRLAPRRP